MTVPRSTRFYVLLSLSLACGVLLLPGQEPAAPAPATAAPAAEKPTEKSADKPKRAKPDDDDDRTARPHRVDRPSPTPTPAPAATPEPKKRGFFSRLFGPRATPTPAQKYIIVRRVKPKKVDDDEADVVKGKKIPGKPAATPTEKKPGTDDGAEGTPKKPVATPAPRGKHTPEPKDTGRAPDKDASREQRALADANKSGDPDAIEKAQYDYARARAMQDDHVRELKAKAGEAISEDESRAGLRAYNQALFDKMRKLQPEISDRIDQMEAAVLKRLGGE